LHVLLGMGPHSLNARSSTDTRYSISKLSFSDEEKPDLTPKIDSGDFDSSENESLAPAKVFSNRNLSQFKVMEPLNSPRLTRPKKCPDTLRRVKLTGPEKRLMPSVISLIYSHLMKPLTAMITGSLRLLRRLPRIMSFIASTVLPCAH
jgi:hypothetical protein